MPPPDFAQKSFRKWTGRVSSAFAVHVGRRSRWLRGEIIEVGLTSQRWRGTEWTHHLDMFCPNAAARRSRHAILFLGGGDGSASRVRPREAARVPGELSLFCQVAQDTGSIAAVVSHTLRQPMFGLEETDLVAYSFDRFLATGRGDWPVLAPMVGSVLRAMDAIQQVALSTWGVEVEGFTLVGFSKRGWAAWLAAAVDSRVIAIAPAMMDLICIERQLEHQMQSWGHLSGRLSAFESRGIPGRLQSMRGQRLLDMVDPARWGDHSGVAKAIISAANDDFWPVDAGNLSCQSVSGFTRRSIIANARHGSTPYAHIVAVVGALHRHAAFAEAMPDPSASVSVAGGSLIVSVQGDEHPVESCRIWTAHSQRGDFKDEIWSARDVRPGDDARVSLAGAATAAFCEFCYESPDGQLSLTTGVWVADEKGIRSTPERGVIH